MEVTELSNGICIKGVSHFYPEHIFECGQAFRWDRKGQVYTGVVDGRVAELVLTGDIIIKIHP